MFNTCRMLSDKFVSKVRVTKLYVIIKKFSNRFLIDSEGKIKEFKQLTVRVNNVNRRPLKTHQKSLKLNKQLKQVCQRVK